MSEEKRLQTFQTPAPVKLTVEVPRGRILVFATETGETRVELTAIHGDATAKAMIADAELAQNGDEIVVRVPQGSLGLFLGGGNVEARIHTPLDSAATLSTGSGRIETSGRLGALRAQSGSGAIRLDDSSAVQARTGSGDIAISASAGSVEAKTGSGRITVGKVGADARITTGSGHAKLGEVSGDATLRTGSGNIEIGQAGDSLEAFAASGNVTVGRADHGRVRAKTTSGNVFIGLANGAAALLDINTLSGRVKSDLESAGPPVDGETHVELVVSTTSGNVSLARA